MFTFSLRNAFDLVINSVHFFLQPSIKVERKMFLDSVFFSSQIYLKGKDNK